MKDGWLQDQYFTLFEEDEIPLWSARYQIESLLPGHKIIGLRGWDDFIVRNESDSLFTVSTVPCLPQYIEPFAAPSNTKQLVADPKVAGKIKWYIKPIAFGGDPLESENIIWITLDEHVELVKWWNDLYHSIRTGE